MGSMGSVKSTRASPLVFLARLGEGLGARSTMKIRKWCLVSAEWAIAHHSAPVALVARIPELDPLLAGPKISVLKLLSGVN